MFCSSGLQKQTSDADVIQDYRARQGIATLKVGSNTQGSLSHPKVMEVVA